MRDYENTINLRTAGNDCDASRKKGLNAYCRIAAETIFTCAKRFVCSVPRVRIGFIAITVKFLGTEM